MGSIKSRNPHTRFIEEKTDSDTGTSFNWRPQGYPPRFGYILRFQIEDHTNTGSGVFVELVVENDTTTNYVVREWNSPAITAQDGATVDSTYGTEEEGVIKNNRTRIADVESRWDEHTSKDSWQIGFTGKGQAIYGEVFIGGGRYVSAPSNSRPTMSARLAGDFRSQKGLQGILLNSYSTITDITLFTSGASTGFATLEGWGPIVDR